MKHPLTLLLVLCLVAVRAQLPTDGLIAHYQLDNSPLDASPFANHGKIKGDVSRATDRFGNPCGAMRFDGATGYISVPSSPSLESPVNAITIATWFKRELSFDTITGNWVTLLCKGNQRKEAADNPQYRFQVFLAAKQSTVSLNTYFTEYYQEFTSQRLELDRWYFYALVYNGSAVSVYLNGQLVSRSVYNKPFTVNKQALEIGRDMPANTEYFTGCIDDLRIYDRALNEGEIAALYTDSTGVNFTRDFEWSLPDNPVHETDKDNCYTKVNFGLPTVLMDCEPAAVIQLSGPVSGSAFAAGETPVRFGATARNGNKQTYGYNILVKDRIAPVIQCPADITTFAPPKSNGAWVEYPSIIATDNCPDVKATLTAGLPRGSVFPMGTSTVTWRATDAANNTSECSFKVTVVEGSGDFTPTTAVYDNTEPVHYVGGVTKADSCTITLLIFDSGLEDNDTVSVIFNNQVTDNRVMLHNRKTGTLQNIIKRTIKLQAGKPNTLILKAWNTGTTWPNTVTIDVYNGVINTESDMRGRTAIRKIIETEPGRAGGMEFSCE